MNHLLSSHDLHIGVDASSGSSCKAPIPIPGPIPVPNGCTFPTASNAPISGPATLHSTSTSLHFMLSREVKLHVTQLTSWLLASLAILRKYSEDRSHQ